MKTDLRVIFKWHLFAFYIFGLCRYPFQKQSNSIVLAGSHSKSIKSDRGCYYFIPAILNFICLTIVTTLLIVFFDRIIYQKHFHSSSKTEEILAILYIGGSILCSSSIIVQFLYHSRRLQTLIADLASIDNILQNNFRRKSVYHNLKNRLCKAFCIIVGFQLFQTSLIMYRMAMAMAMHKYLWVSIHSNALNILKMMTCLQIIFYLQLINFYYDELNRYLMSVMNKLNPTETEMKCKSSALFYFIKTDHVDGTRFDSFFVQKTLQIVKILHFRLWRLVQNCNRIFGWFLISVLFRNYVDNLWEIYWLFLYFHGFFKSFERYFLGKNFYSIQICVAIIC